MTWYLWLVIGFTGGIFLMGLLVIYMIEHLVMSKR